MQVVATETTCVKLSGNRIRGHQTKYRTGTPCPRRGAAVLSSSPLRTRVRLPPSHSPALSTNQAAASVPRWRHAAAPRPVAVAACHDLCTHAAVTAERALHRAAWRSVDRFQVPTIRPILKPTSGIAQHCLGTTWYSTVVRACKPEPPRLDAGGFEGAGITRCATLLPVVPCKHGTSLRVVKARSLHEALSVAWLQPCNSTA